MCPKSKHNLHVYSIVSILCRNSCGKILRPNTYTDEPQLNYTHCKNLLIRQVTKL